MRTNAPQTSSHENRDADPVEFGKIPTLRKSNPAQKKNWLGQLVAFDHCRILLPQFTFVHREDPLGRLHRLAFAEPEAAAQAGPIKTFLARILFALVAVRQLPVFFVRYSGYVTRRHGVTRGRQLRDLWYCAWRHNQFPRHYYWRQLFLIPDRERWLDYLEHRQVNTLLDHLNRHLPITHATNKFRFYHHCVAHELPTPEVLAAWDKQGRLLSDAVPPIAQDLFVKPATDYGSVGIVSVPYDPTRQTYRWETFDYNWQELMVALGQQARSTERAMVMQRQMRNAPRQAVFGRSDISNLRIVTAQRPAGTPEPIAAFIRLPSTLTTTGHDRHVLIASVDLNSGRMSTGKFREITKGRYSRHPDTGAAIAGKCLPGWSDMLALTLRAHRTLPWLPFIGWDVIDTEEGIMLLEANAYWGADALQLPGATPLGRTRFPEIYLEWFDLLFSRDSARIVPALPS